MLLEFLVTSKTRRSLLGLLLQGREASVHDFSRMARSAYAMTYQELEKMKSEGLVLERLRGRSRLFRLNRNYSEVETLVTLFAGSTGVVPASDTPRMPSAKEVKANLVGLGAPLFGEPAQNTLALEEVLALGVLLSKKESRLLRVLPVALSKHSRNIHFGTLKHFAEKYSVKAETGFLLELTGFLAGNRRLSLQSKEFKDARRSKLTSYFESNTVSSSQRELELLNTPKLSRKWCFTMNMGLDAFQSFFDKFRAA